MLYFVGLGLGDEADITVKGLNIIKNCDKIYLESYTSIISVELPKLVYFDIINYRKPFMERA